jgi:hypothetical protein
VIACVFLLWAEIVKRRKVIEPKAEHFEDAEARAPKEEEVSNRESPQESDEKHEAENKEIGKKKVAKEKVAKEKVGKEKVREEKVVAEKVGEEKVPEAEKAKNEGKDDSEGSVQLEVD